MGRTARGVAARGVIRLAPIADQPSTIAPSVATDLDTASPEREHPRATGKDYRPALVLGLVVVGTFVLYTVLALAVGVPRVHPDEVRYIIGASSVVEGEGLRIRGDEYGFGPLHAAVLTLVLWLSPGPRGCVPVVQGRERALLRAHGRSGVPPRATTPVRMVGRARGRALGGHPVLDLHRDGDDGEHVLLHGRSRALRDDARARATDHSPPAAPAGSNRRCIPHALAARRPLPGLAGRARAPLVDRVPRRDRASDSSGRARFHSPPRPVCSLRDSCLDPRRASSLGAYWELWRGYSPLEVAKWLVYHLADIEIYLAVIPLAVTPIVLVGLIRRGRSGSVADSAFVVALPRGERDRARRRRRLHEHAVGLRPPPRSLRVLPPAAVADRVRDLARIMACRARSSRPRSALRSRSCCRRSFLSASSRTRRASTPCRARCGSGSSSRSQGSGSVSGRTSPGRVRGGAPRGDALRAPPVRRWPRCRRPSRLHLDVARSPGSG